MSVRNERGIVTTPSKVTDFLQHIMQVNLEMIRQGKPQERVVPCIWGPAGISKTSLVKQLEKTGVVFNGERIYPKVIHIALAQIEEASDLTLGLPVLGKDKDGSEVTNYAPPAWWPTEETTNHGKTPVIILFDDFNRAEVRILKAIMQILQDYRSNVHELPNNCHIFLTGNPPSGDDGTEYMVNEIDKAIMTRMVHISMRFDKVDWARWAQNEKIDSRVISFVLTYPELVAGDKSQRTNPRSVVQFAKLVQPIVNLTDKDAGEMVQMLAASCLDDEVVQAFMKFTIGDLQKLVEPEEILNNWESAEKKLDALKKRGSKDGSDSKIRTDLIGIIVDRMYVYLMQDGLQLDKKHFKNFLSFIERTDLIPQDLMYALLRRLRRDAKTPQQQKLISDMISFGGDRVANLIIQIV